MTVQILVLRYTAFAAFATLANLLTQRIVLSVDPSTIGLSAAVLAGTLVGLIIKYLLDKSWIFHDRNTGIKAHGQKFALYVAMGVATTAIFWSAEILFWLIWKTDFMREAGAILGLGIGYVTKYNLDRRFVFTDAVLNTRQT